MTYKKELAQRELGDNFIYAAEQLQELSPYMDSPLDEDYYYVYITNSVFYKNFLYDKREFGPTSSGGDYTGQKLNIDIYDEHISSEQISDYFRYRLANNFREAIGGRIDCWQMGPNEIFDMPRDNNTPKIAKEKLEDLRKYALIEEKVCEEFVKFDNSPDGKNSLYYILPDIYGEIPRINGFDFNLCRNTLMLYEIAKNTFGEEKALSMIHSTKREDFAVFQERTLYDIFEKTEFLKERYEDFDKFKEYLFEKDISRHNSLVEGFDYNKEQELWDRAEELNREDRRAAYVRGLDANNIPEGTLTERANMLENVIKEQFKENPDEFKDYYIKDDYVNYKEFAMNRMFGFKVDRFYGFMEFHDQCVNGISQMWKIINMDPEIDPYNKEKEYFTARELAYAISKAYHTTNRSDLIIEAYKLDRASGVHGCEGKEYDSCLISSKFGPTCETDLHSHRVSLISSEDFYRFITNTGGQELAQAVYEQVIGDDQYCNRSMQIDPEGKLVFRSVEDMKNRIEEISGYSFNLKMMHDRKDISDETFTNALGIIDSEVHMIDEHLNRSFNEADANHNFVKFQDYAKEVLGERIYEHFSDQLNEAYKRQEEQEVGKRG